MPGNFVSVSRYHLVGDGLLGRIGSLASAAAGFVPGGGTVAKIAKLALRPRLPGARTKMDILRETIPNISPMTARNVSLGIAGAAAAGAAGLAAAPGIAGLTRQAIARGGVTGLGAKLGGAAGPSLPGLVMPSVFGGAMMARRHRRMNTLNPKALRRATRRLAGFHHFAIATEKELRRLAPVHHIPHHKAKR